MAAVVLGKRSRKVLDEEDISPPLPSTKRRTRRSSPLIYEDAAEQNLLGVVGATKKQSNIQNTCFVNTRTATSKTTLLDDSQKYKLRKPSVDPSFSSEAKDKLVLDENTPRTTVSTPSTVRFKDAFEQSTPSTPKHRVRLVGRLLTPRSSGSSTPLRSQNVYSQARQAFTQNGTSKIIGREMEREKLSNFISNAMETRVGGCTYVSGPPGTGKSALVLEILEQFRDQHIKVASINCVALKSSSEVLARFTQEFCASTQGKTGSKATLARLFTTKKTDSPLHLVLLDEMDTLLGSDCELVYNIFEWAMHPTSSLILIGIANALDLTDRFLPRLKVRNVKPQLLPFLPYSASQISNIITEKLKSLLPAESTASPGFVPLMHPAAIQLSGRKIASQTGDLRKAFSLVRRAIDQVEQETLLKMSQEESITPTKQPLGEIMNPPTKLASSVSSVKETLSPKAPRSVLSQLSLESAPRVSIAHVARIASSIFNNSAQSRLGGLNLQQKAVLCSLVASEKKQNQRDPYKTPSKSWSKIATVKGLFETYTMLCHRDEGILQVLKSTEFRDVVASLETLGLVHEATGRNSIILTPASTPTRTGRAMDDKQVVSAVSEKEMRDSLVGPGSDLLQRLLDD
ncbi:uncharacterized protein A1O9_10265 [Exophiala aquamarina CBS 119918]|uniref:Cell division control protein n=1 Tax=Exophiala aquamarina CBS 119918 TaxID=1182545 RepID=A0A072P3L8_9EURO|nr:uncharacterized protein A1O9_10265 [Exophiala aquamarina CBS 119918]KEF53863.1 hypothetical protein A1O9_10265 [Exophiala aquamarina CBS 119918]